MNKIGKIIFLAGLLLSVVCAFVAPAVPWVPATDLLKGALPWLVGGSGILVGLLNISISETKIAFFALIGLVVALTAILLQPFNPGWLTNIVFFIRVFAAHILLVVSFFYLVKTAKD